jgi:hypothetical protein
LRANGFRDLRLEQLTQALPHELDRHAALAPIHVWAAMRQQIEAIEAVVPACVDDPARVLSALPTALSLLSVNPNRPSAAPTRARTRAGCGSPA